MSLPSTARSGPWIDLWQKGPLKSANKPPAFDLVTARRVVEEQNGEVPLPQRLLGRVRYFTDGVILGSQGFVESHFAKLKQRLCQETRDLRKLSPAEP
jgi:hypothetical protein